MAAGQRLLLLLVPLATTLGNAEDAGVGNAQFEWFQAKGGYLSPKVALQPLFPNEKSSPNGMFATQDLKKGEMIMIVPQSTLITSGGSHDHCDTTRNFMKEIKLGEKSDLAPFVEYMLTAPRGQVPSSWSEEGKELIQEILGDELPPFDVTGYSFKHDCDGSGDALEEDAYMLVISRGWDDLLIPLYGLINHRRGNWTNVDSNSAHRGRDSFVFAYRDIRAGEQLYYDYSECTDCPDMKHSYTAQHMFQDFGFVEPYPQRWLFHAEPDLVFDLNDVGASELQVTWLKPLTPKPHQIEYLQEHLEDQKSISEFVMDQAEQLDSDYERRVILEFYQALTTALETAIKFGATEESDTEGEL